MSPREPLLRNLDSIQGPLKRRGERGDETDPRRRGYSAQRTDRGLFILGIDLFSQHGDRRWSCAKKVVWIM